MALFGSDKPQQSGMEMMLRSMGLSNILDMAQTMASDGTLERIMKFADELERHNSLLEEVRDELRALRQSAIGTGANSDPRELGGPVADPEPESAASGAVGPD